ncbi:hypothetical protein HRbin36_01201 [bacterium HR36]|nr:hypothetical protein HRbin36_01201 [bacterium HR36]
MKAAIAAWTQGQVSAWARDIFLGLVVFAVSFVVSLAFVVWVILRLPVDYFRDPPEPSAPVQGWLPTAFLIALLRNVLGLVLVAVGVILSLPGVPGQGLLTIILGLMLMQFPGKRYLEKRILARPRILAMLNRIRERYGCEPLLPPQKSEHTQKDEPAPR